MVDISFNIACKELKIAQLNQLVKLLHLLHIYGNSFHELSRMLTRKNVNNSGGSRPSDKGVGEGGLGAVIQILLRKLAIVVSFVEWYLSACLGSDDCYPKVTWLENFGIRS